MFAKNTIMLVGFSLILNCNSKSSTEQNSNSHLSQTSPTNSENQISVMGFTYTKPFKFIKDEHYLDGGTTCVELRDSNGKLLPFCLEPPPRTDKPRRMYLGRISYSEKRMFIKTRAEEELLGNILRDSIKEFEKDTSSHRNYENSIYKPGTFTNSIHEYILKRSGEDN